MHKKIMMIGAALAMTALAACETVQGAGQVVQQESVEAQTGM